MQFFRNQWERFKAKSLWGKLTDLLFVALIAVLLSSDGRIFFQRLLLQTGLFGSFSENEEVVVSEQNWNWQIIDESGQAVRLSEFRGQTIFLNFWATWCPPCNAEMPGIIEMKEQCRQDVAYLFVSRESQAKVKSHLEKKGWNIPAYIMDASPSGELAFSSLPTTFVINPSGTLIYRSEGMRHWNDEDALALLKCKANSN